MDEAQAKQWLTDTLGVSRETLDRIELYVALLLDESRRQNLISQSTVKTVWDRHIRDSAQILALGPTGGASSRWLDLGSGPGLPGIVLALLSDIEITLVESRARRAAFLDTCVERLGLADRVEVAGLRLEKLPSRRFDVIVARAFAPLPKLFSLAYRLSHADTLWILPKGKSVEEELAAAKLTWQGAFGTVQSVTDPESFIIVARHVEPRRR